MKKIQLSKKTEVLSSMFESSLTENYASISFTRRLKDLKKTVEISRCVELNRLFFRT